MDLLFKILPGILRREPKVHSVLRVCKLTPHSVLKRLAGDVGISEFSLQRYGDTEMFFRKCKLREVCRSHE